MPFAPTVKPDADLAEVRTHLTNAAHYALELRSRPSDKRDATFADDVRSALEFINEFDRIEKALEAGERAARAIKDAESEEQRAAAEKRLAEVRGGRSQRVESGDLEHEARTMGEGVVLAKGFEEWRSGSREQPFVHEVRNLLGEYTAGAFNYGASGLLPVNSRALNTPSLQRRRPFLRDLLGVQQTGLASFAYIREVTPLTFETGAAMTSEGSAKAEVTMQFVNADAPARKITAWIPVTTEILADAPTLRGYIDARLGYMILIREEQQIYNGDGNAPNLQGLKTVPGVQSQAAVAGDFPATIGQAIGKVENVDGEADGVACNPLDYWVAVTKRYANQFDNGFGGNAPGETGQITWGLPAVRTRALASGSAMVAAWRMGATVFEREGVTIRVGDQHSTFFVENKLAILAEERIAFPIWRPDFFVDVTVPTT